MLHAINPCSLILAAIRVRVDPLIVLLVKLVLTFVPSTVLPHIAAEPMHDSILELTLEVASIGPLESTEATHLVIAPSAGILRAISPKVGTLALLYSAAKVAVIVRAVAPNLNSFAVLLILR